MLQCPGRSLTYLPWVLHTGTIAAEQEDPDASYRLAYMHKVGRGGLPQDDTAAAALEQVSAEQVCFTTAFLLLYQPSLTSALTVPHCCVRGIDTIGFCCQGHVHAMNSLAERYISGECTRRAAEHIAYLGSAIEYLCT